VDSQLSPADEAPVRELIGAVTAARSVDEYVANTLEGLLALVPSVDVSWNEVNALEQSAHIVIRPDPTRYEHLVSRFAALAHEHPIVRHVQQTNDSRTHLLDDFMPREEFEATALYREIFEVLGIESQMVLPLPAPPGVALGFACNRDGTGFSERDRLIMDTLRPYLVHGYRAAQLREGSKLMRNALSATGWSVALVSQDGEVAELTEGTTEVLHDVGVDLRQGGHIPDALEPTFVETVNGYDRHRPAVPSRRVVLSDAHSGAAGSVIPSPAGPHVVLVSSARTAETGRLAAAGLTPRQIDVAVALSEGGTNRQIARRLGVAEGTVKKHLETVYRALDVDNRASAVATVRSLL